MKSNCASALLAKRLRLDSSHCVSKSMPYCIGCGLKITALTHSTTTDDADFMTWFYETSLSALSSVRLAVEATNVDGDSASDSDSDSISSDVEALQRDERPYASRLARTFVPTQAQAIQHIWFGLCPGCWWAVRSPQTSIVSHSDFHVAGQRKR